jgi:tetratricopeptide (TPR) repeat protein
MFHRVTLFLFLAGIIIVIGNKVIIAQTAPTSGTIEMKKPDGTSEPVNGAVVEVYRSDTKGGLPASKTNAKGQFSFAGLQLGYTYILNVSAPGAGPQVIPGIKPGQDRLIVTLSPGDGRKLTEDEARVVAAKPKAGTAAAAELTADEKKAQADFEAKKKEVEEKNKKAENVNAVITAALKAGNEAFQAKNYDAAIAEYDRGIAADPKYVGSAPIFHNNRGTALMTRGVDTYNKAVKAADVTEKVAGMTSAKKDFVDSANEYIESWNVLKNASATEITDKANYEAAKLNALRGAKETFRMAVRTEQVDPAVIETAKVLIPEYMAIETDGAKKAEATLIFADLYRVAGDMDNAVAGYKGILDGSPDNLDALAGAGLSLVNLGYINNDKTKMQEGANLLQKYASIAPDGHKYKADAQGLIESLKKDQNVTPQKVAPAPKKKPGN